MSPFGCLFAEKRRIRYGAAFFLACLLSYSFYSSLVPLLCYWKNFNDFYDILTNGMVCV